MTFISNKYPSCNNLIKTGRLGCDTIFIIYFFLTLLRQKNDIFHYIFKYTWLLPLTHKVIVENESL